METVKDRPSGYLTSREFGDKVGVAPQAIMYAFRRGRFPEASTLWWDKGGQKALLIHESRLALFVSRTAAPKPGPKPKRKPKVPEVIAPPVTVDKPVLYAVDGGLDPQAKEAPDLLAGRDPMSIHDADLVKLYRDQIATKTAMLDLQVAQNKLIECDEVAALWSEMAVSIRQALLAIVPRIAARLAAETDMHKCRSLLQKEIKSVLADISKFGDRYKTVGCKNGEIEDD